MCVCVSYVNSEDVIYLTNKCFDFDCSTFEFPLRLHNSNRGESYLNFFLKIRARFHELKLSFFIKKIKYFLGYFEWLFYCVSQKPLVSVIFLATTAQIYILKCHFGACQMTMTNQILSICQCTLHFLIRFVIIKYCNHGKIIDGNKIKNCYIA